ncbi:MAG TPA: shikimate dehydrogenase [Syntrophobacteraceae bacterium]|jgi:shikimate dehydrogenase|nr:shikimate dehydrogenase [Syntrophobacteraceae bacterium]
MIRVVQTDLFAVIGHPVAHSLSPVMMNAAFASLGLPAHYLALDVDDLAAALPMLAELGIQGLSVTLPHKELACELARKVDQTAREIGAINTLKRVDDPLGWEGINTDWIGAMRALQQVTSLADKRALVIGAGGSARAVTYGLKRERAEVVITNRTAARGEALAEAFQCAFVPLAEVHRQPFDILVQCTSVGLSGSGNSDGIPLSVFCSGMVVMDLVYRPLWTPFLQAARDAGCVAVSGLDMLLYQGVAQFEWWWQRSAPVAQMQDALLRALNREGQGGLVEQCHQETAWPTGGPLSA